MIKLSEEEAILIAELKFERFYKKRKLKIDSMLKELKVGIILAHNEANKNPPNFAGNFQIRFINKYVCLLVKNTKDLTHWHGLGGKRSIYEILKKTHPHISPQRMDKAVIAISKYIVKHH